MRVFSYSKILLLVAVGFSLVAPAAAQRRDYLNEKEADLVRDNQQIDLRIDVLIKAINRRFMVLNGEPEGRKDWEKASDLWGEMPAGPSPALYGDINKLLQKAVDDIDDVAAHDRMDSKFFPKAVRALGSSAEKYLPRLKTAFEKTKDEKEKGSLIGSIELCEQIVEAVGKLPPEVKETKKEKKNKKSGT
jgi:hypothetical protein